MAPNPQSNIGMTITCHHHNIPHVVEVVYLLFSNERFQGTQMLYQEAQRTEASCFDDRIEHGRIEAKRRKGKLGYIYVQAAVRNVRGSTFRL